ncbi:hypothetical protein DM15PD_16600 [Aristophania vespae]|nr:hypothetical protein DM15PD_16600 [Aristophania vespae]
MMSEHDLSTRRRISRLLGIVIGLLIIALALFNIALSRLC